MNKTLLVLMLLGLTRCVYGDADDLPPVVGPQGPAGPTGAQGKPGNNGTNGTNGVNGANGVNGVNGLNGKNGADGVNYSPTHFYGGLDIDLGLYDGKVFGLGLFNSFYAAPSDWANVSGVRLSFQIGSTYADKQIKALNRKLNTLEAKLREVE